MFWIPNLPLQSDISLICHYISKMLPLFATLVSYVRFCSSKCSKNTQITIVFFFFHSSLPICASRLASHLLSSTQSPGASLSALGSTSHSCVGAVTSSRSSARAAAAPWEEQEELGDDAMGSRRNQGAKAGLLSGAFGYFHDLALRLASKLSSALRAIHSNNDTEFKNSSFTTFLYWVGY